MQALFFPSSEDELGTGLRGTFCSISTLSSPAYFTAESYGAGPSTLRRTGRNTNP